MTFISLQPQREAGASVLGAPLASSLSATVAATSFITATLSSTQNVKLRRYQQEVLEALRLALQDGARAPVVVLPTGSGKTHLFCALLVTAVASGQRVLVVVPSRALLTQTVAAIKGLGVEPDVFAPGFPSPTGRLACVGTVQTLARRLGALPAFDAVLVDEAHHVVAGQWRALIASQPRAVTIGFTATPERRDGKGIGVEAGGVFDAILVGATIKELTEQGYLAKTRCFAPECKLKMRGVRVVGGDYHANDLAHWMDVKGRAIIGDAVSDYLRRARGLPALAFCCSVKHSEQTAALFNAAGVPAVAVHQGVSQAGRDAAFAGLRDGTVKVVTSCNLISEGFDCPAVGCVVLLRPTKSRALHVQQAGRGLRPAPGKPHVIINDHVGNLLEFGLPDADVEWSLAGKERKKKSGAQKVVWRCGACGCLNKVILRRCAECGEPRIKPDTSSISVVEGRLAEVTAIPPPPPPSTREPPPPPPVRVLPGETRPPQVTRGGDWPFNLPYRAFLAEPRTDEELEVYRARNGYRPGWVYYAKRDHAEAWGRILAERAARGAHGPRP